jgi:hypothetical protein
MTKTCTCKNWPNCCHGEAERLLKNKPANKPIRRKDEVN